MIAAKKEDTQALKALKRLTERRNDPALQLQLGEVYQNNFHDKLAALDCFRSLVDQGYEPASDRLNTLIHQDARCAYALAKHHESEKTHHPLPLAYEYYARAMQADHTGAREYLVPLAEAGNADAQYALGFAYHHQQGQIDEAIAWCLKAADQKQPQAISYFKQTAFTASQYLSIAQHYEKGEMIAQNLPEALTFYLKACDLQDKEAAYHLGQFYQLEEQNGGFGQDSEKASDYFMQAVRWGHPDALVPLQRLRDEVSFKQLVILGQFYQQLPFSDQVSANLCYERAAEAGNIEAQALLAQLFTGSTL